MNHFGLMAVMLSRRIAVLMLTSSALLASHSMAADLASGADVFATDCADCHSMTAGVNKKGPSLFGIMNKPAASVAGFAKYSDALKASKVVWTNVNLASYVKNPRTFVVGGRMKYDGLDDAALQQDLIAFLNSKK